MGGGDRSGVGGGPDENHENHPTTPCRRRHIVTCPGSRHAPAPEEPKPKPKHKAKAKTKEDVGGGGTGQAAGRAAAAAKSRAVGQGAAPSARSAPKAGHAASAVAKAAGSPSKAAPPAKTKSAGKRPLEEEVTISDDEETHIPQPPASKPAVLKKTKVGAEGNTDV